MAVEIDYDITDEEILAEEEMPESTPQFELVDYLLDILKWLYRVEGWFISGNLAIIYDRRKYLSPDLAVFKGVVLSPEERKRQKSYRVRFPRRPPPPVVFEISSKDIWPQDVGDKIGLYGQMGVHEYFAYDPNTPQVWQDKTRRLRGWRYTNGLAQEIAPEHQNWLWSEELKSWLASDDQYLRLYDRQGQRRRTEAETERTAKEAAFAKLRELGFDPEKL
jgi:Uma2 family endonuclease